MKNLFGIPVLESILDFPEEERLNLISFMTEKEELCATPKTWLCDLITSYASNPNLHYFEEFSFLKILLQEKAREYADFVKFDFSRHDLNLENMWFNIYRKGHSQEKHDHGRSFLSCAYIMEAPENCADFVFYNPTPDGLISYPSYEETNLLIYPVKAETNKLIMFPGWLEHGVRLNKTNEPRISISANWGIINKPHD